MLTTTPHIPWMKNVPNLLSILENETTALLEWFKANEMKSNEDKCHLLIINHQDENCVQLGNENIVGRFIRRSTWYQN